ncbi:MAG: cytochrome oxidase assembly protein [Gammaproteobacteria bacterium]|nr:cytochrome oxidase assembly protein [Gammaproteobacteria bacterium]
MTEKHARSRAKFLLLALLFFGPVAIAMWGYYLSGGWRPAGQTEHGDLVYPARPLPEFSFPDPKGGELALENLRGMWTLLYIDGWDCDTACVDALYNTRQIRTALGKDMDRVQRVFLVNGPCCELRDLGQEHPDLKLAWLDGADRSVFIKVLPAYEQADPLLSGRIYLVDPLGNLMMSYGPRSEPKGILSDLKKLLKLSHIG